MFQGNQVNLNRKGFGLGGGASALTLAQPLHVPVIGALPRPAWIKALGEQLANDQIVVDLGARIGSREWFRGLISCTALCAAAIALAPDFRPLPGDTETPMAQAQWDEARALAINPLAYGGDTGRRMAPTDHVELLNDTPERPRIELTTRIGQGDGFSRVLQRAGVATDEAHALASMVSRVVPLSDLKAGTSMDVVLGRRERKSDPRPLDSLLFRARFDLKLAIERIDGALRLKRIPIAVDNTPLRLKGRVGSSLYRSARAAGVPAQALQDYIRALSQHMSVSRDVGAGAVFDLVIEHRRAETGEVETGPLLYAGLEQGSRKTRLLKWNYGGRQQWFEAAGVSENRGVMRMPVIGRLTSSFGLRQHPILGFSRMHQGMDFGAPTGTPIVAATDGVVSFSGWHGGHGNYVKLSHSNGIATGYGHMSRILARAGSRVSQGQVIGYVGSTGISTGPHLHYEVFRNNVAINPATLKFTTQQQLAGSELARFRAKLNNLLSVRIANGGASGDTAKVQRAEKTSELPPRG